MDKIFAIIPARSGSKGVKDKNIKKLLDHTLLEWSVIAANKSTLIERIFISTDSLEYAKIGKECGAEVPFLRPSIISGDHSSDLDFVIHSMEEFNNLNLDPQYLVHLRPTTPLRDPEVIDEAISLFLENKDFNSLRSVHKMSESSYKTLEINDGSLTPLTLFGDSELDTNAPRQTFPETYQANGYIDILSTKFINESGKMHGEKTFPFVTDPAFEVDSIEDFNYLEYLALNSPEITKKLF